MKKISYLFLLVLFVVYGCSSVSALKRVGFRSYSNSYTKALKEHTKSFTLYRDFSTIAKVTVTRFNRSLFKEYSLAIVGFKSSNMDIYKKEANEFSKYDVYYVAFYTPDMSLNNLEEKNTFWNVYLSACGNILEPVSIKFVDKNDWRASWLYSVGKNRWWKEYIVEFKKVNCKHPVFVISSFLGSISLRF